MWCRSIPFGPWRERRPTSLPLSSCGARSFLRFGGHFQKPPDRPQRLNTHWAPSSPETASGSSRYAQPCCGFWLFSAGELGACRSPTESTRTKNIGRDLRIVGDPWVYGRVSPRGLQTSLVVRSAHHARRRGAFEKHFESLTRKASKLQNALPCWWHLDSERVTGAKNECFWSSEAAACLRDTTQQHATPARTRKPHFAHNTHALPFVQLCS